MKQVWQLLAGLAVASIALFIFFRGVNFHDLMLEFMKVPVWAIVATAAMSIVSLFFRSIRLHLMLPKSVGTNKANLFGSTVIGFMVNNILPAHMGEGVRMLLLWKKNKYPFVVGMGSLLIERTFDMLTLAFLLLLPVFFIDNLHQFRMYTPPFIAAIVVSLSGLIAYRLAPIPVKKMGKWLLRILPKKIQPFMYKISSELSINLWWLWDFRRVVVILVLSIVVELCYSMGIVFLVRGAHDFSYLSSFFVQAWASLGAAIPFSPGYVGTLHAMMLQGLSLCGIPENEGRVVTILYHALGYLPVTLLGFWFLVRMKISWREITSASKEIGK